MQIWCLNGGIHLLFGANNAAYNMRLKQAEQYIFHFKRCRLFGFRFLLFGSCANALPASISGRYRSFHTFQKRK